MGNSIKYLLFFPRSRLLFSYSKLTDISSTTTLTI